MKIKGLICKFLFGIAALLVIAKNGFADTDVSGAYFTDTTWSVQESPYIVKGDVQIPSGVTLTIQPGVTIKYSGAYQILVKGIIIANGTAGSRITFTSSTPSTSSGATMVKFEGADLSKSQLNYITMEYASKSIRVGEESEHNQKPKNSGTLTISNVEITNAEILTDGYQTTAKLVLNNATINKTTVRGEYPRSESIEIVDSKISDSTINSESYNYGIKIVNSYVSNTKFLMGCCDANIKLENSIISSCTYKEGGGSSANGPLEITRCLLLNGSVNFPSAKGTISNSIFAYDNSFTSTDCIKIGNGTIKYLSFIGNGITTGLVITGSAGYSSNGTCNITYSDISKNVTGISLSGGTGSFSMGNSNVTGNSNYNIKNNKAIDVTASNNYWGTTTTSQIEVKIFDYYDNINYGKVTYNPYLSLLDVDAPISPPADLITTTGTGQIALRWSANSESDIKGYKVYYGTSTGYSYTNSVDVGSTTSYTITGLSDGKYYVAVTAYDANYSASGDKTSTIINENQTNGNESWYTEEKAVTLATTATTPSPTPVTSPTPQSSPTPVATPTKMGAITGAVVDATTSKGISGAKVATDTGGYAATTQPDGSFAMEAAPGTYQVKASADGYEPSTQSVTVTSVAPSQVVFQLKSKGTVTKGTIYGAVETLDEEGDKVPLEGVTVTIEGAGYSNSATTDEDGLYQFSDLSAGDYKLTFELEGYEPATVDVALGAGDDYELNVTLEPIIKAMITGNVVDKNGNPIASAKVKLKGIKTKFSKTVTLDEDGYFEFTDLEADTYILTVKAKGYKQARMTRKVADGEQVEDLEIILKKLKK